MSQTVGTEQGEAELEESTIHDVLRNDRRRLVIETLRAGAGSEELGDLAEAVAARESGTEPPPPNKRQSVYVSLHQTHLPKLDSLNIVEYDDDRRQVALLDRVEEIEVYMEVVPEYGLSWGEFYFGWGLLGLVTVLAIRIGVPGVSSLGATTTAAVFFFGLMTASVYHVYSYQDRVLFERLLD